MGFNIGDIINGIFGGDATTENTTGAKTENQKGSINDNNKSTTNTNQTTQTGSVTASNQTSNTTSSQSTRLLSDEQIAAGNLLLSRMSTRGDTDLSATEARIRGTNDSSLKAAAELLDRAKGAQAALDGNVDAIIANARMETKRAVDKQYSTVVGAAGSQFSSAAQDIFSRATTDQEVALAGLAAEMAQKNRAQATQELIAATTGLANLGGVVAQTEIAAPLAAAQIRGLDVNAASNLLNTLKGGVSTSTGSTSTVTAGRQETQSTTNSSTQSVVDATNNRNIDINSNVLSSGTSNTNNDRDLIDLINSLK